VIVDCPRHSGYSQSTRVAAADRSSCLCSASSTLLRASPICSRPQARSERLNPRLSVEGIVLTMLTADEPGVQIRDEVHRIFPGEIFDTLIRVRAAL